MSSSGTRSRARALARRAMRRPSGRGARGGGSQSRSGRAVSGDRRRSSRCRTLSPVAPRSPRTPARSGSRATAPQRPWPSSELARGKPAAAYVRRGADDRVHLENDGDRVPHHARAAGPASSNIRTTSCGFPEYIASTVGGNRSHHIGSLSQRTIATALTAESASQSTVNWPSESSALGARRTVVAGDPA